MKELKKIAVINDLSGLGKCSLTAAIPVISVMGVQACPFPTAILSNQTGYAYYFLDDYTEHMDAIMQEWKKRDFHADGIYTGFLSKEEQADEILRFMKWFGEEQTLVLTDPVMGDQGRTYDIYTDGLCGRMRELCGRAQVITPNLTEAMLLLYGKEQMEKMWGELSLKNGKEVLQAVQILGEKLEETFSLRAAVITGIDYTDEKGELQIGNLVREKGKTAWVFAKKEAGSYSGTGDLFASVLSAGLVKGMSMETCVQKAVRFLGKAIHDAVEEGTDRNDGVCFETYLHELWDNEGGNRQ